MYRLLGNLAKQNILWFTPRRLFCGSIPVNFTLIFPSLTLGQPYENACEIVVCEKASILYLPLCVHVI